MMINESHELFFAKATSLDELVHLYFRLWWNNYNSEFVYEPWIFWDNEREG